MCEERIGFRIVVEDGCDDGGAAQASSELQLQ
jgi:hypothetical protein